MTMYVEKRSYLASVSTLNVIVPNTRCPEQQHTQFVTSQLCFPLFDISFSRLNNYHLIIYHTFFRQFVKQVCHSSWREII
jgi:hypothetical protein